MSSYNKFAKVRAEERKEVNQKVSGALSNLSPRTAQLKFDLSEKRETKLDTNKNATVKALELVATLLSNFTLPSKPVLQYHGVIKNASDKNGVIADGIIKIGAQFRTLMGHRANIDIPVIVREKSLLEPALFFFDGAPYVMCGPALDDLIKRGTLMKDMQHRQMLSPPSDEKVSGADLPRVPVSNTQHMYNIGPRNPWTMRRHSEKKQAQAEQFMPFLEGIDRVRGMIEQSTQGINTVVSQLQQAYDTVSYNGDVGTAITILQQVMENPAAASVKPNIESLINWGQKQAQAGPVPPSSAEVAAGIEDVNLKQFSDEDLEALRLDAQERSDELGAGGNGVAPIDASGAWDAVADARNISKELFSRGTKAAKDQRKRTNIDVPTEIPEVWEDEPQQYLDPAERERDTFGVGSNVKLIKDYEVRDRGGSTIIVPSGEQGRVVRDEKADGLCLYVEFPALGLMDVVPKKCLKPGKKSKKKAAVVQEQVDHLVQEMLREGYQTVDIKAAIKEHYPEHANEALSKL